MENFNKRWLPLLLLVTAQAWLSFVFLRFANGQLIFSDDHPSFLYRFQLLGKHFPNVPFYNTDWNAGYFAREFFPSASLGLYLVSLPLLALAGDIYTVSGASGYTYLIPYLFIGIVPLSVYFAARVSGLSAWGAAAAGVFALAPTTIWFTWLLKYGTVGFCFSSGLFVLSLALAVRVLLAKETPTARHYIYLLLSLSLCVSSALLFICFIPLAILVVLNWRQVLSADRRRQLIYFVCAFGLVNSFWLYNLIVEFPLLDLLKAKHLPGSNTTRFLRTPKSSANVPHLSVVIEHALSVLKMALCSFPFAVATMSFIGLFGRTGREYLRAFLFTIFSLFVVVAFSDAIKPQLELRRLIIPAAFTLCVVAGAGVEFLGRWLCGMFRDRTQFANQCALALWMSLLSLAPLHALSLAGEAYKNESSEKFVFAPAELLTLSEAIRDHGGNGRVFFSGFILHDLGATDYKSQDGGHIAPLATFSGKELYAFDFYHRLWSLVDPIPSSYRKRSVAGIEEFLDLINASSVVTFRREWVDYCRKTPGYREVFQGGRFRLFERVRDKSSFILTGEGTVRREQSRIFVSPRSPEIVVKYRYIPGLHPREENGVELFPVPVFEEERGGGRVDEVSYIGLRVSAERLQKGGEIEVSF